MLCFSSVCLSVYSSIYVSVCLSVIKCTLLFSNNTLSWLKVIINTFILLQKISISNKLYYLALFIHQQIQKKKKLRFPPKKCTSLTTFNINNINKPSWTPNWRIRIISEGSCDTEDWSNDAENVALHHGNKYMFQYYCNNYFGNTLLKAFTYNVLQRVIKVCNAL